MNGSKQMDAKGTEKETGGEITPVAAVFVRGLLSRHQGGARHGSFAQMVAGKYLMGLPLGVMGASFVFRRHGALWGDHEAEPGDTQASWSQSYQYYGHLGMELSRASAVLGTTPDRFSGRGSDAARPAIASKSGGNRLLRQVTSFSAPSEVHRFTSASQDSGAEQSGIFGQSTVLRRKGATPEASPVGAERAVPVIGPVHPWFSSWHENESEAGLETGAGRGNLLSLATIKRDAPIIHAQWPALMGWGSENSEHEAGNERGFFPEASRQHRMRPWQVFMRAGGVREGGPRFFHGHADVSSVVRQGVSVRGQKSVVHRQGSGGRWANSAVQGREGRVSGAIIRPALTTSRPLIQRRALGGVKLPASPASNPVRGQVNHPDSLGERRGGGTGFITQGRERVASGVMTAPFPAIVRPFMQPWVLGSAARPVSTPRRWRTTEGTPFGSTGDGGGVTAQFSLPTSGPVRQKEWHPAGTSGEGHAGLHMLDISRRGEGAVMASEAGPAEGVSVVRQAWPALQGGASLFETVMARHHWPQQTIRGNTAKPSRRGTARDSRWVTLGMMGRSQVGEPATPAHARMPESMLPLVTGRVPFSQPDETSAALNQALPLQTSRLEELVSRGVKRADLIMGSTAPSPQEGASREAARGSLPVAPTTMLFRVPPVPEQPALPVELVRHEIQSQMRSLAENSPANESKLVVAQPPLSISSVADRVYHLLERRLIVERERRGLFS